MDMTISRLEHIDANRATIASLCQMLLMICNQPIQQTTIYLILSINSLQNPTYQFLLALHIIIAISPILSCMENGPTQEINTLVIIHIELHREIEHLVSIEFIYHKSTLRRKESLQTVDS